MTSKDFPLKMESASIVAYGYYLIFISNLLFERFSLPGKDCKLTYIS